MLGIYPGYETDEKVRRQAEKDAYSAACEAYNWRSEEEQDEEGVEDEGPDVMVQVYNPEYHDARRSGGGSFENDFARMENNG